MKLVKKQLKTLAIASPLPLSDFICHNRSTKYCSKFFTLIRHSTDMSPHIKAAVLILMDKLQYE